jgi:hypothetical protein
MPAMLTLHRTGLSATFGIHDAAALTALRTAPAGPSALVRMQHTASPTTEGDRSFDIILSTTGDAVYLDYLEPQ